MKDTVSVKYTYVRQLLEMYTYSDLAQLMKWVRINFDVIQLSGTADIILKILLDKAHDNPVPNVEMEHN